MSVRDQIQVMIDHYVDRYENRDLGALMAMFADDATLFSPYGPAAYGKAAISDTHEEWFAAGEINKRMALLEVRTEANLACCTVSFAGDYPDEKGDITTESGVSVILFVRSDDAGWKFQTTSLTSDVISIT